MEHNYTSEVKRVDRWIAYIATRTWIRTGVYVAALLEATISPLLPELVVAAVLSYRKDISWKVLSFISALGSVTGAAILYIAGRYLYHTYQVFFNNLLGGSLGSYVETIFSHNVFVSMFLAAFTPLPDRVFAFLGGVLSLPFIAVLLAFFAGRYIRVAIVAYFSYHYGDEARHYILKHTKQATITLLLLISVYILIRVSGIL